MALRNFTSERSKAANGKYATIHWDSDLPEFGVRRIGTQTDYVLKLASNTEHLTVTLADAESFTFVAARNIATIVLNVFAALTQLYSSKRTSPATTTDDGTRPQSAHSRLLTYDELKSVKGITHSRRNLRRLEDQGKFPKRLKLGHRTVVWLADDIDLYIESARGSKRL